jgi:tetratricopeptide (TPR) repeat protein
MNKIERKFAFLKFKETVIGLFAVVILVSLVIFLYKNETSKQNRELAKRIGELSPKGGPPETIDGLRQAIAIYEEQIERNVREGVQTGTYWKILAIRLSDTGMYNDSLAAFERALYFQGDDPTLYYLIGVAAANVAKSIVGFNVSSDAERERYFRLAENSYLRAIDMDKLYARPLYGISVMYVFELNRPADAIPYLERLIETQTNNIDALAVLARAYYMMEHYSRAVETYETIISKTKNKDIQMEALNNIDIIQRRLYD